MTDVSTLYKPMIRSLVSVIWVSCALSLIACAVQQKPQESQEKYFVTFAEGFTAGSDSEDPIIGWQAFTAPEIKDLRTRMQVYSLVVHPSRIQIRVGEIFSLQKLIITALDSSGKIVRRVPFSLAYEKLEPDIIETQKEKTQLINGLRPGEVDLRITSMIPRSDGRNSTAFISLYVQP